MSRTVRQLGLSAALLAAGVMAFSATPATAATGHCAAASVNQFGVGMTHSPRYPAPTGSFKTLVIPVDFSDKPGGTSAQLNAFKLGMLASPARITTYSHGRLYVNVAAPLGWQRLPQTWATYQALGDTSYFADALTAAKNSLGAAAFAGYDFVTFLGAQGSFATYAHGGAPLTAPDGTQFKGAVTFGFNPASAFADISHTQAHETLHLFQFPDLYGYDGWPGLAAPGTWSPAAGYDLMGGGTQTPHPFAWMKWRAGWIDDAQVTCVKAAAPATETLTPIEQAGGKKLLVVRTSTHRLLTAEVRSTVTSDGLGCSDGVLITAVVVSKGIGQGHVSVKRRSDGQTHCVSRPSPTNSSSGIQAAAWQTGMRWTDSESGTTFAIGAKGSNGSYQVTATPKASYARTVLNTPGLAAQWRLGEVTRPNPSNQSDPTLDFRYANYTGVTARDAQDLAHTPTTFNRLGALVGDKDVTMRFNGSTRSVITPIVSNSSQFTVEGWTKLQASTPGGTIYGASGTVRFQVKPTGVVAQVWAGGVPYTLTRTTASNVETWVYWTFVRTASSLQIFRNGAYAGGLPLNSSASTLIGGTIAGFGNADPFVGDIDELAVYGVPLSASTIQARYQLGTTG